LKKLFLLSVFTLGILIGGNAIDKPQDEASQLASVEDVSFTTYSVPGDPGGGEI
jgi:hypothetical protein